MKWGLGLLIVFAATACQQQKTGSNAPAGPETHVESTTNWTAQTELFMEYPALVAGETSRFAVHLTRLDNFKPLSQAGVDVRLTGPGQNSQVFRTDAPSRPGIFGVDVKPAGAGEFQLSVSLDGEGIRDTHNLGKVTSSATREAAVHEHPPAKEETIGFLKEQQWTLDFGTAIVESRQLKSSLRVPAEVIPRSGGAAEVTVPFDGRLVAPSLPALGTRVSQGQILAQLLPPTSTPNDLAALEMSKSEGLTMLQLAQKDRTRAERLVASGAVPAKRLDEALAAEATAQARLNAAERRLEQYELSRTGASEPGIGQMFALRAPISGFIQEIHASPGAHVKSGEVLFQIVDLDTVYVSAIVPEAELPQARSLSGAELEVPGTDQPRRLQRLVSIGQVVDPASRTFSVIYEVDNRDRRLAINQTMHVRILTATAPVAPVVPESAIVDDGGRPIVFVQDSGESFVRRAVEVGVREGGFVQVLGGVKTGERVVTRGAHLIRLASMSTQVPSHGHVH